MDGKYEQPTIVDHGSLAQLTLQSPKSAGANDGIVMVPDGTPLGTVS